MPLPAGPTAVTAAAAWPAAAPPEGSTAAMLPGLQTPGLACANSAPHGCSPPTAALLAALRDRVGVSGVLATPRCTGSS